MGKIISHDSETPAQGQQVITVCGFIHRQFDGVEKVFLARRAATKKFLPDLYEMPGGHVDFGEDIVEGLRREVREEFGMHIGVGDPFSVFTYINKIKGSHSIEVVYFGEFTDPIENIRLNAEDHSACGWFAEDELDQIINSERSQTDPEIHSIRRGFALMNGNPLNFS